MKVFDATYGILGVGDEVFTTAERANGCCGQRAGTLGFLPADGFVGLSCEGNGGEGCEKEGEEWEAHGADFCLNARKLLCQECRGVGCMMGSTSFISTWIGLGE